MLLQLFPYFVTPYIRCYKISLYIIFLACLTGCQDPSKDYSDNYEANYNGMFTQAEPEPEHEPAFIRPLPKTEPTRLSWRNNNFCSILYSPICILVL
jgi:hypothetical protein